MVLAEVVAAAVVDVVDADVLAATVLQRIRCEYARKEAKTKKKKNVRAGSGYCNGSSGRSSTHDYSISRYLCLKMMGTHVAVTEAPAATAVELY